jgi:hypothetical protein
MVTSAPRRLPHAAQLQADHAGADYAQALGHFGEVERADVVDDVLAIELANGSSIGTEPAARMTCLP